MPFKLDSTSLANTKMAASSTTNLQSKEIQTDLSSENIKQLDQLHENSSLTLPCNQIIVNPCKEIGADLSSENIEQTDQLHENPSLNLLCNQIITNLCKCGSDSSGGAKDETVSNSEYKPEKSGCESRQERLRRHWIEVAGKVRIPERWDQENLLKDWMDYSSFDDLLAPNGLGSAREALVSESRRARSTGLKL